MVLTENVIVFILMNLGMELFKIIAISNAQRQISFYNSKLKSYSNLNAAAAETIVKYFKSTYELQ